MVDVIRTTPQETFFGSLRLLWFLAFVLVGCCCQLACFEFCELRWSCRSYIPFPPKSIVEFVHWPHADEKKPIVYVRARCSLVVAVDAGRGILGLRGEGCFRLPLYTRNGQVREHVQWKKKSSAVQGTCFTVARPFLAGVLITQRFPTQILELYIQRLCRTVLRTTFAT